MISYSAIWLSAWHVPFRCFRNSVFVCDDGMSCTEYPTVTER